MTYEVARQMKSVMEVREREAAKALSAVPGISSGPMGLTPDEVKASPEYRNAKADYEACREALRRFNAWFMREYGKEYRAEWKARRAA